VRDPQEARLPAPVTAQDVNRWKDLGPKLVLQAYRDFVHTRSHRFLEHMWPVLVHVMQVRARAWHDMA
jgi:uncharacterized protein (DUF608 family)